MLPRGGWQGLDAAVTMIPLFAPSPPVSFLSPGSRVGPQRQQQPQRQPHPLRRWLGGLALLPLVLLPAAVDARAPQWDRSSVDSSRREPVLRVLLQQGPVLQVAAGSVPLRIGDDRGRTLLDLPSGGTVRLSAAAAGLEADLPQANGSERQVSLPLQQVWIEALPSRAAEPLFLLDNRGFRGRLLVRAEGGRLQAINHVGVESYLASVVGSEMPASWPQAALRAQAVAARTYALSHRRPAAVFDLKATVASQMYKGVVAETASTREAVASTRSQVLMHGSDLINAVFHSSSGGITENSGELWSRQLPYLVSVPDADDRSPLRSWQKRLDPQQLRQAFVEIGGVSRIEVLSTSTSGRIRQARVSGPGGSLLLSGTELRQRLGLRSSLVSFSFERPALASPQSLPASGVGITQPQPLAVLPAAGVPVAATQYPLPVLPSSQAQGAWRLQPAPTLVATGRGFGHGVGMSQWGAYGLALRGRGYEQILRYYYRGAEVRSYGTP
jgi:stage II sporulation protein D